MNDKRADINDNEIRIISTDNNGTDKNRKPLRIIIYIIIALVIASIAAIIIYTTGKSDNDEVLSGNQEELVVNSTNAAEERTEAASSKTEPSEKSTLTEKAFTERKDTTVNGIRLSVLTPKNAIPSLELGNDVLDDSTTILIVQAADVRRDNGGIVGSFIVKGQLISKSEAKAGFCAIINGEISMGVAETTQLFEQALLSDGYFFRQYPLVVGGQIVENKPKGKSKRKALAELNGKICVIISHVKLTFYDFSQALVDAGVRNAIYLVGGESNGSYVNADGQRVNLNQVEVSKLKNVNYIVWR